MSWPTVQLQELALQQKGAIVSGPFGSNIGSRFFVEQGVPVIRGNNLSKGEFKFIDDGFVYLTDSKAAEFVNCLAIADDIIFTAAGSIGQVGLIPKESRYDRYVISNKQLRVRLNQEKADPLFVYYWLSSKKMIRYLEGMNNGGAVPLLNLGIIRRVPIPSVELKTQQRIAYILSTYDDLIENNRRRIQLLEQAARLLYKEWFVYLRFPGHEHTKIQNGIPEGWEKKPLSEIASTNAESYQAQELPDEITYIDIASVAQGRIAAKNTLTSAEAPGRARRKAKSGDVIWSNVRPNLRAYALILDPEPNAVVSTGFTVLSPVSIPYSYLYMLVTTDEFVGHLVNHATGVSYPAVRPEDFERATVLVPPKQTLELFHEKIEASFRLLMVLEKEIKVLAKARDLLLPRLMNGEVAV